MCHNPLVTTTSFPSLELRSDSEAIGEGCMSCMRSPTWSVVDVCCGVICASFSSSSRVCCANRRAASLWCAKASLRSLIYEQTQCLQVRVDSTNGVMASTVAYVAGIVSLRRGGTAVMEDH